MWRDTSTDEIRPGSRCAVRSLLMLLAVLPSGCGGGPKPEPSGSVAFVDIAFRLPNGEITKVPPVESLAQTPWQLGAPLNTAVLFRFDGVPQGPFNALNLPVFTTAAWVTQEAGALPGAVISAKGEYVAAGSTVEFRPFLPTAPVQTSLSAPPDAVPGLLPGSLYVARVSSTPGQKIGNLAGLGGEVTFGTTSLPALWFPAGGALTPPALVSVLPADGELLSPSPFDNTPYGLDPTFAEAPRTITLVYDRPLFPGTDNLDGTDLDGNGVREPMFMLRAPATRLLVGALVPPASTLGNPDELPIVRGLDLAGAAVPDGGDLVVHGPGLPDATPALTVAPESIAMARDPSWCIALLPGEGGTDRVLIIDHVLGDPTHAKASDAVDVGADLTAIVSLVDGRLLAFDRNQRRLTELGLTLERHRPTGTPVLLSASVDEGWVGPSWPPGMAVLDLARLPDGRLAALVTGPGEAPRLVAVGVPGPFTDPSAPEGLPGITLVELPIGIVDVAFETDTAVLALDAEADLVLRVDIEVGSVSTAAAGVAAYGTSAAGARCLARADLELDVSVELASNDSSGAVVVLTPQSVLPMESVVDVVQRADLRSLSGISESNTPGGDFGANPQRLRVLATLRTEAGGPLVHDVFLEEFVDNSNEGSADPYQPATWAAPTAGAVSSGALQAGTGVSDVTPLGDLHPLPDPGFDPAAYEEGAVPAAVGWTYVFLDTDLQNLPLPGGGTPGVATPIAVAGGHFVFHDVIIPEGVWVKATGSHPLRITATGRVEIHGVLDVSGYDGLGDDSFDSGWIPVPGGAGGPSAGRGGNGHPTRFNPTGPPLPSQYVTPETGERGYGPVLQSDGTLAFLPVGGHGGVSTLGYKPASGPPTVPCGGPGCPPNASNGNEHHRPPGGGGGSFLFHGMPAHEGTGVYLVQSESTWFPFTRCPTNDNIQDSAYGNEWNKALGVLPNTPLQCVYMTASPSGLERKKAGGLPGELLFADGDPTNDFFGEEGELTTLLGGQGGGGGGSRVDSMVLGTWSGNAPPAQGPSPYPKLVSGGVQVAPTLYDAKGGGAGGGGGALQIRSFSTIVIGRTGRIDASGGNGNGGEVISTSNWTGGGGGGSGGVVVLQAAQDIVLEADPTHRTPGYVDSDGALGASIDVSGGYGKDAITTSKYLTKVLPKHLTWEFTRGDGGQGGFGLIQLQEGTADGIPTLRQGAFAYARQRAVSKQGAWSGHPDDGAPSIAAYHPQDKAPWPEELWYYDVLEYRSFRFDPMGGPQRYMLLQGSHPGIVEPHALMPAAPFQLDTPMIEHGGRMVVREPQPELVFKSWFGIQDGAEIVADPDGEGPLPLMPGVTYAPGQDIPLSVYLAEPSGLPLMALMDGVEVFDPENVVDRLPLIHPHAAPPPFGSVSRGVSCWLDTAGVALRMRNEAGLPPPFFAPVNGTYAASDVGLLAVAGRVVAELPAAQIPARLVANTPNAPFDPGLWVDGLAVAEPFNDIKVDAPFYSTENAIPDIAAVSLDFQGAYAVRAGSHVPDEDTVTAWTHDLTALSGYPLVRFRVTFDVAAFPDALCSDGCAPSVDRVRMRMRY